MERKQRRLVMQSWELTAGLKNWWTEEDLSCLVEWWLERMSWRYGGNNELSRDMGEWGPCTGPHASRQPSVTPVLNTRLKPDFFYNTLPTATNLVKNFRWMSLKLLSWDAKDYRCSAWNSISALAPPRTPLGSLRHFPSAVVGFWGTKKGEIERKGTKNKTSFLSISVYLMCLFAEIMIAISVCLTFCAASLSFHSCVHSCSSYIQSRCLLSIGCECPMKYIYIYI